MTSGCPPHHPFTASLAWSDVSGVVRRGGVTAVRLRIAGSALPITDRAFASAADRDAFARMAAESAAAGRARAGA